MSRQEEARPAQTHEAMGTRTAPEADDAIRPVGKTPLNGMEQRQHQRIAHAASREPCATYVAMHAGVHPLAMSHDRGPRA